ncbi:uncharacterized protein CDAR_44131 [Caerostris darwini]|uniref:Uncharacterized protein n=1 Tax=Caerostris darwini TaxID=1538125 RepID=A0AAV4UMP7_9ARAC|nr:uncharacterized protein CDAR_44131 [Caerostris darwini]
MLILLLKDIADSAFKTSSVKELNVKGSIMEQTTVIDIDYLKTSIGNYLSQALTELSTRRPERPIEYMAYYLISLHEKELELQKDQQRRKKKSESRLKLKSLSKVRVTDLVSNTNQIVSSVISEIVDVCESLYDPQVKDSSVDIIRPSASDIPDRRMTAPILIDVTTHLDEGIAQLIIAEEDNNEFTAQVHDEMPHAFEVDVEDQEEAIKASSKVSMVQPPTDDQIESD